MNVSRSSFKQHLDKCISRFKKVACLKHCRAIATLWGVCLEAKDRAILVAGITSSMFEESTPIVRIRRQGIISVSYDGVHVGVMHPVSPQSVISV